MEEAPLAHGRADEEMKPSGRSRDGLGVGGQQKSDEHSAHTIAARLSEEALTEFLDRLDAHDIGAEIYLPLEFEGRVTVGEYRVASSQALLGVLEEVKEELDVDPDAEDEDEEEEQDEE